MAAPVLVTALVAAGTVTGLVGLPGRVVAGTPGQQASLSSEADVASSARLSKAQQPWQAESAAAMLGSRGEVGTSRGSADRLTLAWGTAAAAQGRQAMALRAEALQNSIGAGVAVTESSREGIIALAAAKAFHEPVLSAPQTSGFGWRWGRMHNGLDFGADIGTPLYAVAAGTVTTASWNSGLGYHVKITLDTGEVVVYGHLSQVLASTGDRVEAGTKIGKVGSTGRSTGAHLHFEVRVDGEATDPLPWLEARRP